MRASPEPPPAAPSVELLLALPGMRAGRGVRESLLAIAGAAGQGGTGASLAAVAEDCATSPEELIRNLCASGLAAEAGTGEPATPVVIDDDHLTTRRNWMHERGLARLLTARASRSHLDACRADAGLATAIAAAFPVDPGGRALGEGGVHWQRLAACTALARDLAVVTGGPGTGKTTVAAQVVGLLAGHRARTGLPPPRVVLAAPTAKAAQRLAEAVRSGLGDAAGLADWSSTLHRLIRDQRVARIDLAVIDEISMADAAILHRALAALPDGCRILLLGDPDQLASVEPGRVLGEITALAETGCDPGLAAWHAACGGAGEPVDIATGPGHPLARVQVRLQVNWRSGDAPPLAAVVRDLQAGRTGSAMRGLDATTGDAASWVRREDPPSAPRLLIDRLASEHARWADAILDASDAETALAMLVGNRWLTALRQGPWGCEALNDLWETGLLRRRGMVADASGHYPGRPLLATGNRRDLGLDNGSLGVVRCEEGVWVARFAGRPGSIPLHRLDAVAPAWFLTVHKAQGSQAPHIEVIGPPAQAGAAAANLASRELVYTAITRASRRVRLWWDADGLRTALTRRSERRSGLGRHLLRAWTEP